MHEIFGALLKEVILVVSEDDRERLSFIRLNLRGSLLVEGLPPVEGAWTTVDVPLENIVAVELIPQ